MLKKTLTYENFNGKNVTEVVYFNLTKADLIGHIKLIDELEDMREALFDGETDMTKVEERELTNVEVSMLVGIVEKIVEIAYGKRSEDGLIFEKTPEVWGRFRWSAAYDEFIIGLFKDPPQMIEFISSILPTELAKQARAEMTGEAGEEPSSPAKLEAVQDVALPEPDETSKGSPEILTDEELLKADPRSLSQDQLVRAFQLKTQNPQPPTVLN